MIYTMEEAIALTDKAIAKNVEILRQQIREHNAQYENNLLSR